MSPEAQAIIDAMTAPPPVFYQDALDDLMIAVVAAGVLSKLRLYDLGGGTTEADSRLNFTSPGTYTLTKVGALTWQKGIGTSTDGTTGYLNCGFAPNALGQNDVSAHILNYPNAQGVSKYVFGNLTDINFRLGMLQTGGISGRVNSSNTITVGSSPAIENDSLMSIIRRISSEAELWYNGVLVTTEAANTSTTPVSGNFTIFRSFTNYAHPTSIVRMAAIGQALSAIEMAALSSALAAFRIATGPRYWGLIPAGQSNIGRLSMTAAIAGSGDGTAGSDAISRITIPLLQGYLDAAYTDRPNVLRVVDTADTGSSVLGTTAGDHQHKWWDYETDTPLNALSSWEDSVDDLLADGRDYNLQIAWSQGEADVGQPSGRWKEATKQVHAYMRTYLSLPTMPIVIHPFGRNSLYDDEIRVSRSEQAEMDAEDAYLVLGPETLDIQRDPADWHAVNDLADGNVPPTGYDRMAEYVGRAAAAQWGCDVAWKGPQLASATKTGATTIVATLGYPAGCEGTDFTPMSAIEGFRVVDDGGEKTIFSAARLGAGTVQIEVSSALGSNPTLAYDNTPDYLDRTQMIRDNAAFPMPMRWHGNFISINDGSTYSMAYKGGAINAIGSTNDPPWDGVSANPSIISLLKYIALQMGV